MSNARSSLLVRSLPFLSLVTLAFAACTALENDALEDAGRTPRETGKTQPPATSDSGTDPGGGAEPPTDPDSVAMASPPAAKASAPTLFQSFDGWIGTTSPDNIWRLAGVWTGTGGNTLDPANAQFAPTYAGAPGVLLLTSRANTLNGGEIQTLPSYGYGYYETSMQVSSVAGVCDSFFWVETDYGAHQWTMEFLTNEPWLTSADAGQVHLTIHPSAEAYILNLPFNPSKGFHRYGFLWKPGTIDFTVDGQVLHSFASSSLSTIVKGYIMMTTWTGDPKYTGGPPTQDATVAYDWVKYYADVATLP